MYCTIDCYQVNCHSSFIKCSLFFHFSGSDKKPSLKDKRMATGESPTSAESCDGTESMEITVNEQPMDQSTGHTEHVCLMSALRTAEEVHSHVSFLLLI